MNDNASLLGFNGAPYDPVSGTYHLGNGYRTYSLVLKQFLSPDSMSPFGAGGINPYAYCAGDPINHSDPSGHFHIGGFGIFGAVMAGLGVVATGAAFFTGGLSLGTFVAFSGAVMGATSAGTGIAADNITGSAHDTLAKISLGTGIAGFALDAGGAGYNIAGKFGLINREREVANVSEDISRATRSSRGAGRGAELMEMQPIRNTSDVPGALPAHTVEYRPGYAPRELRITLDDALKNPELNPEHADVKRYKAYGFLHDENRYRVAARDRAIRDMRRDGIDAVSVGFSPGGPINSSAANPERLVIPKIRVHNIGIEHLRARWSIGNEITRRMIARSPLPNELRMQSLSHIQDARGWTMESFLKRLYNFDRHFIINPNPDMDNFDICPGPR